MMEESTLVLCTIGLVICGLLLVVCILDKPIEKFTKDVK
ncbi:hypothetical protein IIO_00145 [Bacillus cereus VD115]|nr:hypothetical protein IIO_00145 [Bacillus cereus VD115]